MTLAPVVSYWKVLGWTEDFWGQFCEQQRLVFEGTVPDNGLVKTAKEWGVTVVELQHLILESGLVLEDGERRSKLANRMLSVSEMAVEIAMDKIQSDEEVTEMNIRDAAMVARQMSDASLNLKNGTAAPSVNITLQDIKAVIALNRSMPDEFVPIAVNEKIESPETVPREP